MSGQIEQFGKVPSAMVMAGKYRELDRSERGVLWSVAAHIGGKTWTAEVSLRRIAFEAGVCERTVSRVVERLERKQLISVFRQKGRGHCNIYTLTTKPDTKADVFSNGKTDTDVDGFSRPKPVETRSETRQIEGENRSNSTQKPDTHDVRQTEEQNEQQNRRTAAAIANEAGQKTEQHIAIMEALTEAKIAEPTRSRLVKLRGISPELVREVNERTRSRGGGTGAVVNDIRAASDAAVALAEQHQVEKTDLARAAERRRAEEQRADLKEKAGNAWFYALCDSKLNQYAQEIMNENATLSKVCKGKDPRIDRNLKAAIIHRHRSEWQTGLVFIS